MAEKKSKKEEVVNEEKETTKKSTKSAKVDDVKKEKPTTQKKPREKKTKENELKEEKVEKVKKVEEVEKPEKVDEKKNTKTKKENETKKKVEKKEGSTKTKKTTKQVKSKNKKDEDEKVVEDKSVKTTKKTTKKTTAEPEKEKTLAKKTTEKPEKEKTSTKKTTTTKTNKSKKDEKSQENKTTNKKKLTRIYAKKREVKEVAKKDENTIEIQFGKPKKEKIVEIREIKETIKSKKTIPQEELKKIYGSLFKNVMWAIVIVVYFIFLNLGFKNIEYNVYVTDLKVFSMCILLFAIILLEYAYKKDSGEYAIYGIEMIVLSIINMGLIYISLMFPERFLSITAGVSFVFAIYYLIKTIIRYIRKRKKYFVDNMKEIIKEEE